VSLSKRKGNCFRKRLEVWFSLDVTRSAKNQSAGVLFVEKKCQMSILVVQCAHGREEFPLQGTGVNDLEALFWYTVKKYKKVY
jgi:hypothetical protein